MSLIGTCSIKVPQEMPQYLKENSNTESRYVEYQSRNVYRMAAVVCRDLTTCNSQKQYTGTDSAVLSERDSIATLKSESNNTIHLSQNILPSHSACSINQRSLQENDRLTTNCNIMNHQDCNSTWKTAREYFNLSRLSSITKHYFNQNFRLWKPDHLWISRIFLVLICLLHITVSIADTNKCAVGLTTPGRTWPQGDIVLEHGQPLKIFCILNETYVDLSFSGKNASDLVFFRNKKEMEPEYIRVINETTIVMDIQQPPPAEDMYYCKLKLQDDIRQYEAVCLNKVVIGFKPEEPKNFSCLSHNWENIVCSWNPVQNYVTTRFLLMFKVPGKPNTRKLFPCPKEHPKPLPPNTCLWDTTTNPIYRQPYENYTFIMKVDNVLGNDTFMYRFHHYAYVIPAKPANLSVTNKTANTILLNWNVPFPMQNFPPGLHHKIMYQDQWHHQRTWHVINITDNVREYKKNYSLTGLKYANTIYDVRVFMKSAVAKEAYLWSEFSDITFRTPPKLPGLPPRTDIGSFEITENSASRDVYLYWQSIPQHQENGDNFTYHIDHVTENGRPIILAPNETTRTYAKFKGLSFGNYVFEIVTTNIVGANKVRAKIFVPSRDNMPPEPIAFTKIAFDGGLYELSWKPPIMRRFLYKEITNYTIFWCDNERDRPYQCTGYLDWTHVSKDTRIYNITVPDPAKVYQFAISANTESGSSGMVWASCTVIHNKVVGKMKSVWINRIGSNFIDVGWKLDCSDRIGAVEAFNIYYCPIVSPYNTNCKNSKKLNSTIKADSNTIHGVIDGLQPYTTYLLSVAVLTKNGEGLHSDALYNTTLEDAPSTPPQNVTIENVTNTTMFITWKPPEAMNGVLRDYEVYYNQYVEKVSEKTYVKLTNLSAYKNFSISIAACTVSCSEKSQKIYGITQIGVPGKTSIPNVRFINSSQVMVKWDMPEYIAGPVNYYQILSDDKIQNSTKTEAQISISDCNSVNQNQQYKFRVRAVNIAFDNEHLEGPWSEPGEGSCYSSEPSNQVWYILKIILGIIVCVAVLASVLYASKRGFSWYRKMQDVDIKLPSGLPPDMRLLHKVEEQHIRQSSADSSGCSSGQVSVTSSLTSDCQVSNDSGTEVNAMHIPPDKLLQTLSTWESTSLRQRNINVLRPDLTTDADWEPYVKVAKSEEPIFGDTLSLTRSTSSLTENTGCTTSQHTSSSTGTIPSSEETLSNPSPVPKEGYSIISSNPKTTKKKSKDDSNIRDTVDNALISIASGKKPIKAYMTLANLEQRLKEQPKPNSSFNMDELPHVKPSTSRLIALPSSSSNKIPKSSYVQTASLDTLQKPFISKSNDPVRSNVTCESFAPKSLTDSCHKHFVSSFAKPTSSPVSLTKSFVVSSIPEVPKPSDSVIEKMDLSSHTSQVPISDTSSNLNIDADSMLEILQKEQTEPPTAAMENMECNESTKTIHPLCKQTSKQQRGKKPVGLDKDRIITKPNTSYVTIVENPILQQQRSTAPLSTQPEPLEKPPPQATTTQSDTQYSKVAVVPSTSTIE